MRKMVYLCIMKQKGSSTLQSLQNTQTQEIMETIIKNVNENVKKATFGIEVQTLTEVRMNKTNNPYLGRVTKITTYRNAMLGVDYANAVNNQLERVVGEGVEKYDVQKAFGMHRYDDFFMQSDKDENQFYLSIIEYNGTTKVESIVLLDGKPCTSEERESIRMFEVKKSTNIKKQLDAGLSEEQQRRINRPKVQNVVYIKQGAKVIFHK